jgi:hypothetical protein
MTCLSICTRKCALLRDWLAEVTSTFFTLFYRLQVTSKSLSGQFDLPIVLIFSGDFFKKLQTLWHTLRVWCKECIYIASHQHVSSLWDVFKCHHSKGPLFNIHLTAESKSSSAQQAWHMFIHSWIFALLPLFREHSYRIICVLISCLCRSFSEHVCQSFAILSWVTCLLHVYSILHIFYMRPVIKHMIWKYFLTAYDFSFRVLNFGVMAWVCHGSRSSCIRMLGPSWWHHFGRLWKL